MMMNELRTRKVNATTRSSKVMDRTSDSIVSQGIVAGYKSVFNAKNLANIDSFGPSS
jgi:hypothetical protein